MHIKFYIYAGILPIMSLAGKFAHAQEARTSPLADLYACQALKTTDAKNKCYDTATTILENAEQQGKVVVLYPEEFKEIQEGIFGFKHTRVLRPASEQAARTNTLDTMTVPVKKIERYLSGYVITLDNNQVWEQFAGSISRVPKGKLSAQIKTTSSGSYKMTLYNPQRRISNIKVRRIQ